MFDISQFCLFPKCAGSTSNIALPLVRFKYILYIWIRDTFHFITTLKSVNGTEPRLIEARISMLRKIGLWSEPRWNTGGRICFLSTAHHFISSFRFRFISFFLCVLFSVLYSDSNFVVVILTLFVFYPHYKTVRKDSKIHTWV